MQASSQGPDPSLPVGPIVRTPRVPRHNRGLAFPYEGCNVKPVGSLFPERDGITCNPFSDFVGAGGAADMALPRRTILVVNLRSVLCVVSWDVLSLSEDHGLPHLSDELSRLRVNMVGLSETRRPDSGETRSKCFIYH